MRDIRANPIRISEVTEALKRNPNLTTPDLADVLNVSVSIARWVVLECGLEFYDGNHIRHKV